MTLTESVQGVLLKRFGMAALTYAMVLVLVWLTVFSGFYRGSMTTAVVSTVLVVLSQVVFFGVFRSGYNQRFADKSLTEAQVVVGLCWLSFLLTQVDAVRGSLMMVYLVILLFGVSQLSVRRFISCAIFAFCSFIAVNLFDIWQGRPFDLGTVLLQATVLIVGLIWISLFTGYVQALRQRMHKRSSALRANQTSLREMMSKLEQQAATDELTGLFNRRHFIELAHAELDGLADGTQIGLALIDLDHFKQVNDKFGHAAGDRVLQTFATVGQACLREGDVLARYGGEEFVLFLPDCDADRLTSCCERLREAFASAEPVGMSVNRLSLSAGMTLLQPGADLDAALQQADQALYRAKDAGRNRCNAAWEHSGA